MVVFSCFVAVESVRVESQFAAGPQSGPSI